MAENDQCAREFVTANYTSPEEISRFLCEHAERVKRLRIQHGAETQRLKEKLYAKLEQRRLKPTESSDESNVRVFAGCEAVPFVGGSVLDG